MLNNTIMPINMVLILKASTKIPPISGPNALPTVEAELTNP